jgi:HD-GYP domain-containing protein (c-di-GMP phosphodiesterase class II)
MSDCRSSVNGCVATYDGSNVEIMAGIGNLAELGDADSGRAKELADLFLDSVKANIEVRELPGDALLIPLEIMGCPVGFIYLDNTRKINANDRHLLRLFTIQCASALENNRLQSDLKLANKSTIRMLAVASEFKDTDTANHVKRLARQTKETAQELGISDAIAESYAEASLMHDVGKIGIPDVVLMKPGRLNNEEFGIIKSHPGIGAQILKGAPGFDVAYQVAIYHHERWDGTGYPAGLAGEDIPLAARIVAVVDVFDALVSKRPYKKPWSVEDALQEIKACSGSHFDPRVVEAFLAVQKRRGQSRRDVGTARDSVEPRRAMDS